MGVVAQNMSKLIYFQIAYQPLLFIKQMIDEDHDGTLSLSEVASKINEVQQTQTQKELEFSDRQRYQNRPVCLGAWIRRRQGWNSEH